MAVQAGIPKWNFSEVEKQDSKISQEDQKRFQDLYESTAIRALSEALGRIAFEVDSASLYQLVQHCNRMFAAANELIKKQLEAIEAKGN